MHLETSSLDCSSSKLKDPLVQQLQRFWEIESIGVSLDEGSVHDKFLDTIKQRNGRYEVCLPWREQHPLLPDNFDLAMSRLMTLLPKLRKHPELLAEYDKIISEQTSKGIVSDVDPDEPVEVGHNHYLPHHAVLREDKKTTKCRIVYDVSSKTVGPTLNNCLYSGPSLVSDICDVLIRFWYHRIAIVADIEKAFLMVMVAEHDRNLLRFLWINDINSESPQVIIKRFNTVVFGLTSSPFLFNGTLRHHVMKYESVDPEFVRSMLSSLHVDDLDEGKNDLDTAFEFYLKAKVRFLKGGFNLKKWLSNSPTLMKLIEANEQLPKDDINKSDLLYEKDETYAKTYLGQSELPMSNDQQSKVLGLSWDNINDCLLFNLDWLIQYARELPLTK